MGHVPVEELEAEARALAKECLERSINRWGVVVHPFTQALAGRLANLADHIGSLKNDNIE